MPKFEMPPSAPEKPKRKLKDALAPHEMEEVEKKGDDTYYPEGVHAREWPREKDEVGDDDEDKK